MKVKDCENCIYYKRKTWSHPYKPRGYHRIGMTHAYAYCRKQEMRCADVRKCEEFQKQ